MYVILKRILFAKEVGFSETDISKTIKDIFLNNSNRSVPQILEFEL